MQYPEISRLFVKTELKLAVISIVVQENVCIVRIMNIMQRKSCSSLRWAKFWTFCMVRKLGLVTGMQY
jgi:hypothetical protein